MLIVWLSPIAMVACGVAISVSSTIPGPRYIGHVRNFRDLIGQVLIFTFVDTFHPHGHRRDFHQIFVCGPASAAASGRAVARVSGWQPVLRTLHNSAQVAVLPGLRLAVAVAVGLALVRGARMAGRAAAEERSGRFMSKALLWLMRAGRKSRKAVGACACAEGRSHRENGSEKESSSERAAAPGGRPRHGSPHITAIPLAFKGQDDDRRP